MFDDCVKVLVGGYEGGLHIHKGPVAVFCEMEVILFDIYRFVVFVERGVEELVEVGDLSLIHI